jgi:hypothetical protein
MVSVVSKLPSHRLIVDYDIDDAGLLHLEIYGDQWASVPSRQLASLVADIPNRTSESGNANPDVESA